MVGSDAGNGGNVTLGIVVGIVGRDGIGGSAAAALGRVGIAGSGGNATLGRVGMVGSVGIVGMFGSVGIVGWEDCIKWRAAELTSMLETDNARMKARTRLRLKAAISDLTSKIYN
ncbi:hypothetical protein POM88_019557 [Heracleum sosnowskyi]|uniref:Uncharacterized protein n=1 Tax=Heracleum sosnowskyi TaxID=360622 RepID=A0AAD8IAV8_9APIA|nr:hypothetical protein POM88_019553 [Heracleum sosnowskyi]KAK1381822.1 hypothetical protein POM88_019557 [Heracleum sosnowskyi]